MGRIAKIAQAVKALGADAALITSAPNMQYATGFVNFEGMVFVTADEKGYCYTDSRYIETAEKTVAPLGFIVEEAAEAYTAVAAKLCAKHGVAKLGFEDRALPVSEYEKYRAACSAKFMPLANMFEVLREVKEQQEVDTIVKAQRISEQALSELLPYIKPGVTEEELAARLDYNMAKRGSKAVSFPTILLSGPNASLPHGVPGQRKVQSGEFVLIDFGAVVDGYRSDMTRTVAVGSVSEEMRKIYDTVLNAQLAGIEALNVGKTGIEVDKASRDVIEKAGYGKYFGHGLGHSLGITLHENPRASKTYSDVFKMGNIITMEPGIYIPGHIGVRIEDMIYLGKDGKQNLTLTNKELIVL